MHFIRRLISFLRGVSDWLTACIKRITTCSVSCIKSLISHIKWGSTNKPVPSKEKFKNAFISVATGALASIIATFMLNAFNNYYEVKNQDEQIKKAIENIYIGSNKEWIDEQLGSSTFIYQNEKFLQCVYVTNLAIVNVFFENLSSSCAAYFITLRDASSSGEIAISKPYQSFFDDKPLGEFTYADITSVPYEVSGFVSNGTARLFYGECYYNGASTNYYNILVLNLDYGYYDDSTHSFLGTQSQMSQQEKKFYSDAIENSSNTFFNLKRDETRPNTYGVSAINASEILSLISNYMAFESLQLCS